MKKQLTFFLAMVAMFCALATTAGYKANALDRYEFLKLETGIAKPGKSGVFGSGYDFGKSSFGSNSMYGLAIGHKDNFYRVELAYHYFERFKPRYGFDVLDVTKENDAKIALRTQSVMLNGYADGVNWDGFTPYIGGGLGVAMNRQYDTTYRVGSVSNVENKKRSTKFAWNVGAGVQYELTKTLSLDAGWKYMDFNKFETANGEIDRVKAHVALFGFVFKM
jgi:opacity protein-like surface antigen